MSGPEIKKRHMEGVNTSTMETPTTLPTTAPRTVTYQEVFEWQRDNKYILTGYRPEKADYMEILTSLTFLHNETCNVYTHLIGALLLPPVAYLFMRILPESQFLNVSATDYAMWAIFFCSAEFCLISSATYHLMQPHSHEVEQFWHRMDLLGIVVIIAGTFIAGIYYIFTCDPVSQKVHWAVTVVSASAVAALISIPKFRTLRWRKWRVGAYFAFGTSAFIILLHGVGLYGADYMLKYAGMKWYLIELALYAAGAGIYAVRVPERFAPGKFDIWGNSHQIFHVFILFAMFVNCLALTQSFKACHTLDLCHIQAAHRAGQK